MVTAVVLSKDEEKNIIDCLESLVFCDEIILVDDNSKDRTIEIARGKGAKIYKNPLKGDFSFQRNFGLSKATSDWVLFVDADERVSSALADEIMSFIRNPREAVGAFIKREDTIWGKKLKFGETGNIKLLRLGRKDSGKWFGNVHEKWILNGKTSTLLNPLSHRPHQTIEEFLKEINLYTDIRAKELHAKDVKVEWYDIIFYPKVKFLQNYIIRLGFLDGISGFVFAMIMSFHSFLVRGKLWQLNQKN